MSELLHTGYVSNRGRQILANFLTLDLQQDWRAGAAHFEEHLIDHDVHSNTFGWLNSSGLGPAKVLKFNAIKQAYQYDPEGHFVRLWLPELSNVPAELIQEPWKISEDI
jgi:deoxyribodipyrimidine photo-lyase